MRDSDQEWDDLSADETGTAEILSENDSGDELAEADHPEGNAETAALLSRLNSGANWFYWIAALSVVNSVIIFAGGQVNFVVGLGITQVVDGLAAEIGGQAGGNAGLIVEGIGFVISLGVAGMFVLFGVFANRRHLWAFLVGMLLYGIDGLLFLLVQEWLSLGFHVFVLFCLWGGLTAALKLGALEREAAFAEA